MAGWQDIDAYLAAKGCRIGTPTGPQTTGGSHVPGSLHYAGRARDYGDHDSDPCCVFQALLPFAQGPNYQIEELFLDQPCGGSWDSGQQVPMPVNHEDHTHAAIKEGGTLDPGGTGAATGSLNPVDWVQSGGEAFGDAAGAVTDWIAALPAATIEALLGGHSIVEVLIRTLELFGGAAVLATGVILLVRVIMRTNIGQGLSGARRAARDVSRTARRPVRNVRRAVA